MSSGCDTIVLLLKKASFSDAWLTNVQYELWFTENTCGNCFLIDSGVPISSRKTKKEMGCIEGYVSNPPVHGSVNETGLSLCLGQSGPSHASKGTQFPSLPTRGAVSFWLPINTDTLKIDQLGSETYPCDLHQSFTFLLLDWMLGLTALTVKLIFWRNQPTTIRANC